MSEVARPAAASLPPSDLATELSVTATPDLIPALGASSFLPVFPVVIPDGIARVAGSAISPIHGGIVMQGSPELVANDLVLIQDETLPEIGTLVVSPAEPSESSNLAAELRHLLGDVESIAVALHVRLAAGDPSAWLLLATILGVAFEIARRELWRTETEPLPEVDPDLIASWGLS